MDEPATLEEYAEMTNRKATEQNPVTLYICIGNSDDKLRQSEWSSFVREVKQVLVMFVDQMHGEWFSASDSRYQNACWCVEVKQGKADPMNTELARVRKNYMQDSVAVAVVSRTVFV